MLVEFDILALRLGADEWLTSKTVTSLSRPSVFISSVCLTATGDPATVAAATPVSERRTCLATCERLRVSCAGDEGLQA